jgi:hypothetical protein
VFVFAAFAALQACSSGPAEFPPQLKDPAAELDAVLDAARAQPRALFHPDAEPALQRLGSELRLNLDRATELAAKTPEAGGMATELPEAAVQSAQRIGKIVGLLERAFRCAEQDKQIERARADRVAALLVASAQARGVLPELAEGADPIEWAQKQSRPIELAVPLVRLGSTLPVTISNHFQGSRNTFVLDPCR